MPPAASRRLALSALLAWPLAARGATGWDVLRGGGVAALIRHARAPGGGDPSGFALGDCATQRNLSPEGRAQARQMGAGFQAAGVPVGRVIASRWCRAMETARLAFGDAVEPEPILDSFFANRAAGPARTAALRALIGEWESQPGVLVCVTHQVNITALSGVFPAEGEVIIMGPSPQGLAVAGRLRPG